MIAETPADRTIYRWGGWVWYSRLLALMVYGTSVFVLGGLYVLVNDVVQKRDFVSIFLLALWLLLVAMYALWVWVTWRGGQQKVAALTLSANGTRLLVRTLNFTTRTIALADVQTVEYEQWERHINSVGAMQGYYLPKLVITVCDGTRLEVDMSARVFDAEMFKTLFGFDKDKPLVIRGKHRKKTRGRIVRS